MAINAMEKEIYGLTEGNILQLFQYAKYLKFNNISEGNYAVSIKEGVENKPKRRFGALADGFISIADDFDDTLEGLEDYV